jgi:cytochrome c biogenesis protein CcmG, thiol:disulfide interchange protein DsbE
MSDAMPTPTPTPTQKAPKQGLGSARLTAAAIAAVVALLVIVLATRSPSGDGFGRSPLLGKRAPETRGVDVLTGKTVSLTGLQSVGVAGASGQRPFAVVNFFGTWCPPCATEHPELKAFSEEHAKTGDAFLFAIAYQDTPKDIKAFFAKRGGGWPVVDSDRSAVDWGVLKAPETYIVDPDGIVAAKVNGAVTQAGLNRLLDRLRSGQDK